MNFIKAGTDSQGHSIELFYQDLGQGNPVVLIHGWPLDSQSWEHQLLELPQQGLRVIAYDRRGFGKSSKPWDGYDYDTFADDLKAVLDELDLQNVTLVGFSMGGGEIARYMSRHNGARVAKVAFVSAVTPFMLKTDDNPSGVDKSTFDEMIEGVKKDRAEFLADFGKKFFGVGLLDHSVSQATLDWTQSIALQATPKATVDCIYAFASTDFRQDLASVKVPALIIHGTSDKIVPIETGGEQTAQLLPQAQYLEYDGAPHGLNVTEKDRLNQDLLAFIGQPVNVTTASSAY
ncbi:alpha/beta hydrolase [Hymenobacter sp. GOD-10R]|uniref:alpha/beta fold hydrolase n=1 Tax=Hymenobacter sp. GOD-10R TaxID=3093922 RepID=UPI002D79715D|nr:alpha/beta hydrolase [Hymenobacter sp. GOD-10R]WRQ29868.1 alpha/beta hydrolase [Hymenobacter sp. GOD-10R]